MNLSKSNWIHPHGDSSIQAPMSLRYMNEFVGKLQCAPQLLQLEIFPDAKEVSESMGLFNGARRFLPLDDADEELDGIVVVGDGSTPRTAVMFAYRTKGWTCYSIDPEMRMTSDTATVPWDGIKKVVPIREKIEDIQIHLRKAIIILVHAHVTLEQALSAVHAETIVGVITVPCCNWYGQQEQLFGRHPDLVYDDFSILSDHREMRIWMGETMVQVNDQIINPSSKAMTGCVVKTYTSPNGEIQEKANALQKLHGETLVSMTQTNSKCQDLWEPLLSLLQPFLSTPATIGIFGDEDGSFRSILPSHVKAESFSLTGEYDIVLDLGTLHECMYSIESRVSSALILKLCQTIKSAMTTQGVFVCLTPRRKLKGTSYFANPGLQWKLESKSLGTYFVIFCRQQEVPTDEPSWEQVQSDLQLVTSAYKGEETSVTGVITGIRIKSRKLAFLDVQVDANAMQIVLNYQLLKQGVIANPQQVSKFLHCGDTVTAKGCMETSTKLNAIVFSIDSRRLVPAKSRYGIK